MSRGCIFLLVLPLLTPDRGAGQTPVQEKQRAEARRAKIEAILRVQDLRTPHDGSLRGALSDADPEVRRKAYLAYGSLQDTDAVPLLVAGLADPDLQVQEAAAFAIGQTGTALSEAGRRRLEDDLLWKRLAETSAADRLIEEIGKFGTPEALRQLLIREGTVYPGPHTPALQRSIARFAIRSVTSDEAVRYLLHAVRPAEQTPWQVLYALQRIGDHPETRMDLEQILLTRKHPDPLARMNLAALLAKVKQPPLVLVTLQDLALHDADWRVRVNALRALASQGLRGQPASIEIVRASMFDAQPHVALAAIAAAGASDLEGDQPDSSAVQLIEQLKTIAVNSAGTFHWHTQAEAANSIAEVLGSSALEYCRPPDRDTEPGLTAELLRVAGATGSPSALPLLRMHVQNGSPRVRCGALDGLAALLAENPADSGIAAAVLESALGSLESQDVAVVATAASMLREKAVMPRTPVGALLRALGTLRVPDDIEAYQEICATLGATKDPAALPVLLDVLKTPDPAVSLAAADALQSITGTDYRKRIPRRTEPLHTDLDFTYLRALPDTIPATLETSRGSIGLLLFKDAAPFTIMALAKLADQRGFFRGRTFHRVVSNFVIQGGDPRGDGWGGPGFTLRSEFSPLSYETGTVGIASAGKDTEGSQFFITQSPQPHLDGRYTVVGKVVRGQDVVDQIRVDDRIYDFTFNKGE